MRKYKNLYQHEGKYYTKENRKAKPGDKVLIVNKSVKGKNDYRNGDVLTILKLENPIDNKPRYGSHYGQYLEQSEYMVLVPCATFKRKWTDAEIQEAKDIVLRYNDCTRYMVDAHNTNIIGAYWFNRKTNHYQCATATCMKNDTFDYWIGRMVACLKVHDKQLPEWIKGG